VETPREVTEHVAAAAGVSWAELVGDDDLSGEETAALAFCVAPGLFPIGTKGFYQARAQVARRLYPTASPEQATRRFASVCRRRSVRSAVARFREIEAMHLTGHRAAIREALWKIMMGDEVEAQHKINAAKTLISLDRLDAPPADADAGASAAPSIRAAVLEKLRRATGG
jgi:hypothetical protein